MKEITMTTKKNSFKAIWLYSLMALFLAFEMALQVSPGVITEALMTDLSISVVGLGLMSGVYFWTYTAMQIPSGVLFDRFNYRYLVSFALLACAVGVFVFGQAHGFWLGALSRLLIGAGSAFAFIAVLVVAHHYFAPKWFALLTGIAQLLACIGAMTGVVALGSLFSRVGWRAGMFYLGLLGVLLTLLVWLSDRSNSDVASVNKKAQKTSLRKGLRRLWTDRQTWWIAIYALFNWAPITAFPSLWGVPFLEKAYGYSATQAGWLCALMWMGIGVASPIIGWWSSRLGRRIGFLSTVSWIGAAALWAGIYLDGVPGLIRAVLFFFAGVGASGQALSFAVIKDHAPAGTEGAAIGFNNMAVVASGALFQPLVGTLLQQNNIVGYTTADYRHALWILPACYAICWVIARFKIVEKG